MWIRTSIIMSGIFISRWVNYGAWSFAVSSQSTGSFATRIIIKHHTAYRPKKSSFIKPWVKHRLMNGNGKICISQTVVLMKSLLTNTRCGILFLSAVPFAEHSSQTANVLTCTGGTVTLPLCAGRRWMLHRHTLSIPRCASAHFTTQRYLTVRQIIFLSLLLARYAVWWCAGFSLNILSMPLAQLYFSQDTMAAGDGVSRGHVYNGVWGQSAAQHHVLRHHLAVCRNDQ